MKSVFVLGCILAISLASPTSVLSQNEDVELPRIYAESFEIPQGRFIQLPFKDRNQIDEVFFLSGRDHFFCAFMRTDSIGRKGVFISKSADLFFWHHPQRITTDLNTMMQIRRFFIDLKSLKIYIAISSSNDENELGQVFQGEFGREWHLMTGSSAKKLVRKKGKYLRHGINQVTASHYDVEIDSLHTIFISDWLASQRYFSGLTKVSRDQSILVDSQGDVYLTYDNRESLILPYLEKGPGLVKMDFEKLLLDADGDGLPDVREIYWGLSPQDKDSDGDDIDDGHDNNPLADADLSWEQDDHIRQAALEYIVPQAILQDSAAVISVTIGSSERQSFKNHRCRILCNVTQPVDNIQMNAPVLLSEDEAQIEIAYRGPLSSSHGYTISLSQQDGQWRANGIDRIWSE